MQKQSKILLAFLVAALLTAVIFAAGCRAETSRLEKTLSMNRQHAFAELTTAVSDLNAALEKSVSASSPSLFSAMCTQAYGKSLMAQAAIGELPYGSIELEKTAAFLAKAGDYAMYLSRRSADGCLPEERETLSGLSSAAAALSSSLQSLQSDLNCGLLTLNSAEQALSRLSQRDSGALTGAGIYQTVEADFPEIPTLIYDGPFSEHLAGRKPLALEGLPMVSQEEARSRAASFLGVRAEQLLLTSQGAGALPSWGFSFTDPSGVRSVEVSRQGGQIIELLSSTGSGEAVLSRNEALEAAAHFLAAQGYRNLKESYFLEQDNVLTIHFAAVQDGILCYPDLVKLSLALDTGRVVGFEAHGYLMNHHQRDIPVPARSAEEAESLAGSAGEVLSCNLVIVPTGGEYEVLCYELKCRTKNGRHILIYVNALTGEEEQILLLLEDDNGTLVL